ncbi:MAG TPA: DNA polymerase III subunit epsilon [Gammaproteobacteria bacterium]|nr:DNA polymerase III subunit epsilon [Gammaproteobacteria bacterium]
MRQLILDTETTGLDPKRGHRIIEIGCVEIVDRQITAGEYHRLIHPQREIPQGAINIHGITLDQLRDKPLFAEIASEFLDYIKGAELVIHNAPFDVGFLNYELGLLSKEGPRISDLCEVLDTLALARSLHPGQRVSLDALCKMYHVDTSERTLHGALLDSKLLAEVYLLMTGGQTDFLGQLDSAIATDTAAIRAQSQQQHNHNQRAAITVIKASENELQAHQQWLQRLAEKCPDGCLWQKLEE